MGIVNEITKYITLDLSVNIRKIHFETHDGIFDGYIDLYVHDAQDLEMIMKRILEVKGVESVTRPDIKTEENQNEFYKKIEKGPTTYVKDSEGNWTIVEKEPIPIEEAALYWHEHCVFCWEKAMTNIEGEFYCTKDMYYWICADCFHDFKEKFNSNYIRNFNYNSV